MIKACLIYYNDATLLPMMLPSIEGKVDTILAVDGRIKRFPGPDVLSTDGSTELIEKAGGIIIGAGLWKDEIEKRQHYVKAAKVGDLLFIIDSDEVLRGSLPRDDGSHSVLVWDIFYGRFQARWCPRLILKTPAIHYKYNHWTIVGSDTILKRWYFGSIYHFKLLRDERRKQAKWVYNFSRPDPIMVRTT